MSAWEWFLRVGPWLSAAVGWIMVTRSGVKKRIDAAVESSRRELAQTHQDLLASQRQEINELRGKLTTLSQQLAGQSGIIAGYVTLIQDRDFRISELERGGRHREATITELENQVRVLKAHQQ